MSTRSLSSLLSLSGRVSIVTGAAGSLGTVICESLAELGSHIALVDILDTYEQAKQLRETYNINAYSLILDLSSHEERLNLPSVVFDHFGSLDILVNNAAFVGSSSLDGWSVPFSDQSYETWACALDLNLSAVFDLCQQSVPYLSRSTCASIINISSIYGLVGPDWSLYAGTNMANPAAYACSKGALIQFTRWLSSTLSPTIRVNAISPGGIARSQPSVFVERYCSRTPLRRMASEEDFKGVVALLASDASSYITGQNIVVDGGWTIW